MSSLKMKPTKTQLDTLREVSYHNRRMNSYTWKPATMLRFSAIGWVEDRGDGRGHYWLTEAGRSALSEGGETK